MHITSKQQGKRLMNDYIRASQQAIRRDKREIKKGNLTKEHEEELKIEIYCAKENIKYFKKQRKIITKIYDKKREDLI